MPRWNCRAIRPRSMARAARRGTLIEQAREQVAGAGRADARNVIFTSGGTEANALALSPAVEVAGDKRPFARLLVSAIEHPSVLAGGRFGAAEVEQVPVDADGVIDLARARAASRKRGGRAGSRLADGGEQRNRRDPAGRCGGRDRPPPRRFAARRCRAGGGTHRARHRGARRGSADAERAQDRRREGRRRAGQARRQHSPRRRR